MKKDEEQDSMEENPAVPTELLELHVQLEEAGVTPNEFKEAFSNETSTES